ncbi:hypothetical protein IFR05_013546 [Cadophora sp. M221]|nr:hypothetical protein IFR05_013546 [Cadophora sp. M221]
MSTQPSLPAQTGTGKTILVTGGSGYVAAHVLNSFLSRGYNVRTTVRSQATAERVKKSHTQYLDRLSFAIVKDVATPGAHDEAVKGVDGVVHTASPFKMQVTSNKHDLLDPAINGTLSLLTSIQTHNPLISHVVITSSFASILDLSLGSRPGYTYSEKDWNPITYDAAADASTPGAVAYCASKALAERAVFDYVSTTQEEEGKAQVKPNFNITTLCPPVVYGPAVENSIESLDLGKMNTSSADIYRLVNGSEKEVPETSFFAFVDVRDLGEVHVKAYEKGLEREKRERAERYLVASGGYTYQQVCDVVREEFPGRRGLVPEGKKGKVERGVYGVDNGKVRRELGVEFRGLRECIGDMVREFEVVERRLGVAV